MNAPKLNVLLVKWFLPALLVALFSQSCNTNKEVSPSSGDLSSSKNARLAASIQDLDSFKELMKLQEDHRTSYKAKYKKFKKRSSADYENYQKAIEKAKTVEEYKAAFAIIDDNPDETLDFLGRTLQLSHKLKSDLQAAGVQEESIGSSIQLAVTDFYQKRIERAKSMKLDCQGACSQNLNIALETADANYTVAFILCGLGSYIGYGVAIFTGPVTPVAVIGVGAFELACIGGAYASYKIAFESAIASFDTCWNSCA